MVRLAGTGFRTVWVVALVISIFCILSCITTSGKGNQGSRYVFYGGPQRGTFNAFAQGITDLAQKKGIDIQHISSSGAFENVRRVDSNPSGFGFSYASVIYLGRQGLLINDIKKYHNVMVLGYFYGAPAQLVVKKDAGITSAFQLKGKKVSVGRYGSGGARQAEVFFEGIGVWSKLKRKYLGYNDAANVFNSGDIDAFWIFSAFPNGAAITASNQNAIQLISIYEDGLKANLFEKHPYFQKVMIPAGTYNGVMQDTLTFQDSALLIANKDVPNDVVYQLLDEVYSASGYEHMRQIKKTALMMKQNNGSFGICTPLHPGAIRYYKDQ